MIIDVTVMATAEVDPHVIEVASRIEEQVASVVLGKRHQVRLACAALLAGHHLLVNDLPGVGKTTLATALASVVGGSMGRIQGTPDLLPTDLTGSSVFHPSDGSWSFRPGPLLSNVVLVDELNRITPRSQSALLEAMAERGVTVDGVTRAVPAPFLVVATMNPISSAGTFPLMASQLDRFGMVLGLGPVDRGTERALLQGRGGRSALDGVGAVIPVEFLPRLQAVVAAVAASDELLDHVLDVCDALRPLGHLSSRASRALLAVSRAHAALDGRRFIVPDDVRLVAPYVLAHRLTVEGEPVDARFGDVVRIVESVPVPPFRR